MDDDKLNECSLIGMLNYEGEGLDEIIFLLKNACAVTLVSLVLKFLYMVCSLPFLFVQRLRL
jgi:hypothetical protein